MKVWILIDLQTQFLYFLNTLALNNRIDSNDIFVKTYFHFLNDPPVLLTLRKKRTLCYLLEDKFRKAMRSLRKFVLPILHSFLRKSISCYSGVIHKLLHDMIYLHTRNNQRLTRFSADQGSSRVYRKTKKTSTKDNQCHAKDTAKIS